MARYGRTVVLLVLAGFCAGVSVATAQSTTTYHLHRETSASSGLLQLRTVGPDNTSLTTSSSNLFNAGAGEYLVKEFDTQSGVPGLSGMISSGATLNFTLWMRKTASAGVIYPRARVRLNSCAGALLCEATGTTALTTTMTSYAIACTTSSDVSVSSSDRIYLWVGVNVTTGPGPEHLWVELNLETGFDSLVQIPDPAPPIISSLAPPSGAPGSAVTVSGSRFGSTQGTGTVTFNGIAASVTSWSNSSIDVTVPALATTGPVIVSTSLGTSNEELFVVPPVVTYSYDASGRLVGTVDGTGAAATFVYDAVGNLLSIQRSASGTVTVQAVSPSSGPVGTAVTITGTGYSAVPGQNTVLFNGTAATVTASSPTQLFVTVPTGATTGSVSITTPAGSAAGGAFTVSGGGAPTISGFTPTIATVGSAVTISGTNFSTVAIDNRVQFNTRLAQLQSATSTALGATVPDTATSGRITVETPSGSATSADDFFVPPAPYAASDVLVTHRMTIGSSYTITLGTPNKIGLVVFDASAGQRVSLWGTNGISGQIGLVCDVDVTLVGVGLSIGPVCMEGSGFMDPSTSARAATYTLVVDPASTATGSLTLNLYDVPPDVVGQIALDGSPVTVTMTAPGQNSVLTFSGTAGNRIALLGTNGLTGQAGFLCDVTATIRKPDSTALVSPTCMESSGFQDVVQLPATGTYSILVDPALQATGSLTLSLYDVPADVTGSITPGGSSVPVTIAAPGQKALLTFTGAAAQRISLLAQVTSGSFGCAWGLTIRRVSDNLLIGNVPSCGTVGYLERLDLPTSATYSIEVDPATAGTGAVTLTLYDVPADVTGSITPGGASVPVTITAPGQKALLTFTGTASQRVSLLAQVTSGSFGCAWALTIRRVSDNFLVGNPVSCGTTNFQDTVALPTSATYSIEVDPAGTGTGTVSLTLYDAADATGSIAINGSAVGVSLLVPGQRAVLTFSGTSGQSVTASATVSSGSFGCAWSIAILTNADSVVASNVSCSTSNAVGPVSLPATGTFKVLVDPAGATTGSGNVTLTSP